MNFYALIIGTELLNKRREDKHFDFITRALLEYGHTLKGAFIIADEPSLIVKTIKFIASDPDSILFSFGGVGSTPDDHTRQCAALALRDGKLYRHEQAHKMILDALGKERAYPHAIKMSLLPKDSNIIENGFNSIPSFSLDNRFFFVPGFPEMSHPMIQEILQKINIPKQTIYRYTLTALCRESELIELMESLGDDIESSSLPKIYSDGPRVVFSVASQNQQSAKNAFMQTQALLNKKGINYALHDEDHVGFN